MGFQPVFRSARTGASRLAQLLTRDHSCHPIKNAFFRVSPSSDATAAHTMIDVPLNFAMALICLPAVTLFLK
jgi:hypothetical protein